jgi:hypothetical protein
LKILAEKDGVKGYYKISANNLLIINENQNDPLMAQAISAFDCLFKENSESVFAKKDAYQFIPFNTYTNLELQPLRCNCKPNQTTICRMSKKEIEMQCRHGSKVTATIIGDGEFIISKH